MGKTARGFTIVELLIVIVVIAVLVATTIVAYNGIQKRARDSQRKSDLVQIDKALKQWSVIYGKGFADMNAGAFGGTGVGWFDGAYTSPVSVKQLLINNNLIAANLQDPIGTRGVGVSSFSYMIAECTSGDTSRRVLLAQLELPPAESMDQQLGTTCNSTTFTDYTTNYKMNYGKLIVLQP